jgi:hypothetical protein
MVFGRDMVLPLNTTWIDTDPEDIPPLSKEAKFDIGKEYVDMMSTKLQAVFTIVRRVQRTASLRNQGIASGKHTLDVYERGDPVFLEEHKSVDNVHGSLRQSDEPCASFVPDKWTFQWTGPHVVIRRMADTVYVIHHASRNEEIKVHVSQLRPHHPFSDKLFDTSTSVYHLDIITDAPEGRWFKGDQGVSSETGDFCIAYLPEQLMGPYVVMCNLGPQHDGVVMYQVYNSLTSARQQQDSDVFEMMKKTVYKPGWNDPRDNMVVFRDKKPVARYAAYTLSQEQIGKRILVTGFTLTGQCKLKRDLLRWVQANAEIMKKYMQVPKQLGPVGPDPL